MTSILHKVRKIVLFQEVFMLQRDKRIACMTLLLGLVSDEDFRVRGAAVRALGFYVLFPSLIQVRFRYNSIYRLNVLCAGFTYMLFIAFSVDILQKRMGIIVSMLRQKVIFCETRNLKHKLVYSSFSYVHSIVLFFNVYFLSSCHKFFT